MSNFIRKVRHPITKKIEMASWIDTRDTFGRYYEVVFFNGESFDERDYNFE